MENLILIITAGLALAGIAAMLIVLHFKKEKAEK